MQMNTIAITANCGGKKPQNITKDQKGDGCALMVYLPSVRAKLQRKLHHSMKMQRIDELAVPWHEMWLLFI